MSRDAKTSNIEWIGQIPKTWNTNKVKYVTKCMDGKRVPVDASQRTPGPYPYWGAGSITDHVDKFLFDEELVLLGEDGAPFFDKTRNVAFLINEKVWINNHIHVLKPQKNIDASFLCYALNSVDYREYINGAIINKLTQSDMKTINIPYPPLPEQRQIVSFLDRKCSAIDTAIEKTKKSIEKLEEYKKAVITKAVTKGLDPDAKMKDSGIEWIGEVPEGWEVKRLKYLFYINSGATPKSDNTSYWDGNIKWVTPADFVTEQKWLSGGKRNITEEGYNSCSATIVPSGSIIFSKRAPVGLVVLSAEPLCTNQGCLACVPKTNVEAEYYYYVMSVIPEQFERLASGTTFKEISLTEFMNFKIPAPSIKEQRKIVEKLKERCSSIDSLIAEKQTAIDKWAEYKKSLIYYVVTGKIDCRGESI